LSTGLGGAASPVQIDHMIRGYFGWLGSFVVGSADLAVRPMTDDPKAATPDYWKIATGGMVANTTSASSRYVSQMYEQSKVLEEAYGTWRMLQRTGKIEEAREFAKDNMDKLKKYDRIVSIKRAESRLNEIIRIIERSNLDSDVKRQKIIAIQAQKDRIARPASL
ncbi:hypothetical protein, partial [Undibacterium sp.]|uniref:hypothetical protein n=1 Tax=Undibacterium sp. TaxID=1914977 RepID=UPI00375194B7